MNKKMQLLLAVAWPLYLFVVTVRLYIYYMRFGINVIPYLNLVDLPLLLMDVFWAFAQPMFIIPVMLLFVMFVIPSNFINKRVGVICNGCIIILFIFDLCLSIWSYIDNQNEVQLFNNLFRFIILVIILMLLVGYKCFQAGKGGILYNIYYQILLLFLCFVIFAGVMFKGFVDAEYVKRKHKVVDIIMSDNTIYRGSQNVFMIGKTSGYIFIYNNQDVDIIPIDKVSRIKIYKALKYPIRTATTRYLLFDIALLKKYLHIP